MKIKLTDEQRQKMTAVFATLNELRNDKKFMKLYDHCIAENFDGEVTAENEDDYMRIVNFQDDLKDYANNYFGND
jgi:hypothetical protein